MSFESWLKRNKKTLKKDFGDCGLDNKTFKTLARKAYEKAKAQKDEFQDALKENRQPKCIHCGYLLDSVSESQGILLRWEWDKKQRRYVKSETDDGWSDKPMCDHCQTKDWDFTNNEWIKY